MYITMQQSELKSALAIVSRAVPSKPAAPVNGTIKFIADGSIITMQATDYSISISHNAICQSDTPGMAALPAQRLNEVISALPGDALVNIEVDSNYHATIKSGKAKVKLSGFNPDEFPNLPEVDEAQHVVDIPSEVFHGLVCQGAYAFAKDMSRPVLNAVRWKMNSHISTASADGFHMALAKVERQCEGDHTVLIPGDILATIANIIDDGAVVRISSVDNQMVFSCDDTEITSRTIDGNYPDIETAMQNYTTSVMAKVNLQELKKALRLVGIFTSDTTRKIVSIEFTGHSLKVYSSGDAGEGETEIECEVDGTAMVKMTDTRFLGDALSAIDTPNVVIKTGPERSTPLVVSPDSDADVIALVMPVSKQ